MKAIRSIIDSEYKLATYDNGVEYIVYNSASWLVGSTDGIGDALKSKYFSAVEKADKKPVKINSYKGESTYKLGDWLVYVTRKTISKRAGCGLRNQTSVCDWLAIDRGNNLTKSGYGGIRDAAIKLSA